MRNRLIARDIVRDAANKLQLPERVVAEIFGDAPLDFPVIFSPHLPLFADRLGMVGITLAGSVWLLESVRAYPPAALLSLLRHEAEHVRQQRERPASFYIRYGFGFLQHLITPARDRMGTRFQAAYRGIPFEKEAYDAEARARKIIAREAR